MIGRLIVPVVVASSMVLGGELSAQQVRTVVQNGIGFCLFDFHDGGTENNIPLIYFHGTSSSKVEPQLVLQQIREKKRTVISFDRPGYGDSDPVSFQSLDDYGLWLEKKLLPTIEKLLGFKPQKYDLVSVSGGALYSLKTAQLMPERIRRVSVLSAGLFARPVGGEGQYERVRRFAARRPLISNSIVRFGKRHLDLMQTLSSQKLSAPDREFSQTHGQLGKRIYVDATKRGAEGIVQDARLQLNDVSYARPLGQGIEVQLWNGTCDQTISTASTRLLAEKLGIEMNLISDEGHLSCLPPAFDRSVLASDAE
ncbi:MAG: alpha/beta hydrolase [Planctomycetota bacterium]|nr:alpha/beta hydrolase [Planctomycetota bacterium]